MLLEYNFKNFKSFKDLNSLSMIGVQSFKEHEPNNIFTWKDKKILKSIAIYGNNASGKSNLIDGLQIMKKIIKSSFRDALVTERAIKVENFLLNTESENSPTYFEVIFVSNDIKYRYGFEILDSIIIKEWLSHTTTKEVYLFERDINGYKINKSSFKEGLKLETKTRENVLFLSLVAQFNGKISNIVINWFNNINFISGIQDKGYGIYTMDKLKNDKNFKKWLSTIIKSLEISNITIEETEIEQDEFIELVKNDEKLKNFIEVFKDLKNNNIKEVQISTWHKKFDDNNLLIDTIPFNFRSQESEGTKKFIHLLGPWYDTLKNGKILIVDELDSRLHTHLTKKLIELFNRYNENNAQLLFTSHDITLLDKESFRRDQIWFVEKDQFGISQMYSLADFKSISVRNTSSFSKNYLNGKYGATSYFNIENDLVDLLYNE